MKPSYFIYGHNHLNYGRIPRIIEIENVTYLNADRNGFISLDELENSKIALARTDNILGLAVKGLHEKYLGIENKDLKKFANRYNNLYGIIESMKLKGCAEGQIKRILLYVLLNLSFTSTSFRSREKFKLLLINIL